MLKHRLALAATLAVALNACGPDDSGPVVQPEPELENPAAYFGLEPCTCYEYAPADGGPQRLGVAVEAVTDRFFTGIDHHVVSYRLNGQQIREDFFQPTDPDLVLRRSKIRGDAGDVTWVFEPEGFPFLQFPVQGNKSVVAPVTQRQFGEDASENVTMHADYVAQPVEASLDGETTQSFDSVRVAWRDGLFRDDLRWFVPETGWVRLELPIDNKRTEWVLQRKFQMPGTCPWDYAAPVDFVCGVDAP